MKVGKEEQELASTLAMMSSTQSPEPEAASSTPADRKQRSSSSSSGSSSSESKSGRPIKKEKEASKAPAQDHDDEDYEDDEDRDAEASPGMGAAHSDEFTHSGRFSEEEKTILFNLILKDADLFRAFVHQLTKRKWGGRSWMNEIAKRFNQLVPYQRKHDAVRHHLKLRKARSPGTGSDEDIFESLLEHSLDCNKSGTCSKCLSLHRVRVRLGFASCGWPDCEHCDNSKPHVLEPFNARALLQQVRAQGGFGSSARGSSGGAKSRGNKGSGAGAVSSPNFSASKVPAPLSVPDMAASAFGLLSPGFPGFMPFSPLVNSPLSPMLAANLRGAAFNSPKSARTDRSDSNSSTGTEVTQQMPTAWEASIEAKQRLLAASSDQANFLALQMLLNTPRNGAAFDGMSLSPTNFSPTSDAAKLANMLALANAQSLSAHAASSNSTASSPNNGGGLGNLSLQAAQAAAARAAIAAAMAMQASANKTSPSSMTSASAAGLPGSPVSGLGLGTLALGAPPSASASSSPTNSPSIDRSMVLPFNSKLMELTPQEASAKKRTLEDAFNTMQQEISRTTAAKQSRLSSSS